MTSPSGNKNKTENKNKERNEMELTDAQARHGVRELIRESKVRRVEFRVEVPTRGEVYHDEYFNETTITVKLVVPTDHLVDWAGCEYTGDAPC